MIIKRENFVIKCAQEINYIDEIVDFLETKMDNLMNYFELKKLKQTIRIIVFNDIKKYKSHIERYTDFYDYMCADTYDGNINLLSLTEAQKSKEHKDMTIDDMKKIILHEFVHICQKECQKEEYNKTVTWFWEALATNLGNPENRSIKKISASNKEITNFNSLKSNYSIAFTIGKYLIDNFSYEDILEYVKYPSILLANEEIILSGAREWSKKFDK